jgi:glucose/arabinose dehydrogenase
LTVPRAAVLAALLALACPGWATVVPAGFVDEPVVSGLNSPIGMAFLPDGRLLVAEQNTGAVKLVIAAASPTVADVFTVPEVELTGGERGLLGIAVDPGWPDRAYLYVHYTDAGGPWIRVTRFEATGDLAFTGAGALSVDPGSAYHLLVDVPHLNDNQGLPALVWVKERA